MWMRSKTTTVTVPLLGWLIAMMVATSIPGTSLPEISLWQWDKLAHFFVYGVLAILCIRYLWIRRGLSRKQALIATAVVCSVYAVLDEVHQLWIPMRSCAWQDMVADLAGLVAGLAVYRFLPQSGRGG